MTTSSASYYFMLRYAIALAPLIAPFAMSDRAEAACDPTTPNTFECTGATTGDPFGFAGETDITVNVQSGASVTGTAVGIVFTSGTVNNFSRAVITGATAGIFATDVKVNDNAGRIEATDAGGVAILAGDTANVSNLSTGVIRANGENGIAIQGVTVNVTGNAGRIEATGTEGIAIFAGGTANVINTRTGTISGSIGIVAGVPTEVSGSHLASARSTAAKGAINSASAMADRSLK